MQYKHAQIILIILSLSTLFLTQKLFANERYGKQKVVYHINYDDPRVQKSALRNVQNHLNFVGKENVDIKIIMHGSGLSLLLELDAIRKPNYPRANATDVMRATISHLKNQGVDFQVCGNTLRGKKINYKQDLYDVNKADIVPSGVAELVRLQSMGYAYIKP